MAIEWGLDVVTRETASESNFPLTPVNKRGR